MSDRRLIEVIRNTAPYGEEGRGELLGLAQLAADALEDSLERLDVIRELMAPERAEEAFGEYVYPGHDVDVILDYVEERTAAIRAILDIEVD